jgi:hypothetical protein
MCDWEGGWEGKRVNRMRRKMTRKFGWAEVIQKNGWSFVKSRKLGLGH